MIAMIGRWTAAVTVAIGTLCGAASAQTVEWRFNNSYAATRPESGYIRQYAQDLRTRTNGRLSLTVLEGGASGLRDADALRWMQTGTPEMGFNWPPFLGRDAPDLAALYVYGSVSTAEEHLRALPALREILIEGYGRSNIEVVGFMGLPILQASVFCRQPVRNLDELRRLKLRVGTRDQIDTFRILGVAAQIVPQNDLYSAMQTGVVDCALYAARFAQSISLQEVGRHAAATGFPFPPVPYVIMANRARFRALPGDLQQAIREATTALEQASSDFSRDTAEEAQARERLRAAGVTWYPDFPEADREAIRRAAVQVWESVAREAGGSALDYRRRILQALGRGS
jgi:TRAP-type C4-dicarboxylate transport system substrate-binding protein